MADHAGMLDQAILCYRRSLPSSVRIETANPSAVAGTGSPATLLARLAEEGFMEAVGTGPPAANPFEGLSFPSLRLRWVPSALEAGSFSGLGSLPGIGPDFLLVTEAALPQLPFRKLLERRRESGAVGTLAVSMQTIPIPYDLVRTDREGMVTGFKRNPTLPNSVFLGAAAFRREVLDWIPPEEAFGLPDLIELLISGNRKINTLRVD